jgi:hypothetical protein
MCSIIYGVSVAVEEAPMFLPIGGLGNDSLPASPLKPHPMFLPAGGLANQSLPGSPIASAPMFLPEGGLVGIMDLDDLATQEIISESPLVAEIGGMMNMDVDLNDLCTGVVAPETAMAIDQILETSEVVILATDTQIVDEEEESEDDTPPSSPDVGVRIARGRRIVDSSDEEVDESDFASTQAVPWWKKQKAAKVMLPRPPIKSVYVEAEAEEEEDEFQGLGGQDGEGENDDVLDMTDGLILQEGEDAGVTTQGQAALEELRKYDCKTYGVGSKQMNRINMRSMHC